MSTKPNLRTGPDPKVTEGLLERRAAVKALLGDDTDEVLTTAQAACTMAYQSEQAVAVLLTQKLLGAKAFSTGEE